MRQLAAQFDRVQRRTHQTDPSYRGSRWQRFESAANRYAGNISRSRYARAGMDAQIPRSVYMGLSNG